ncbi:MAG: site-2 protease family protein [Candidatus Nanopelagicales bacterium]
MTLALEALGWVIFLLGIGISIGLHEIGHLVPAKRFGVKVTQYMIGFGPTVWSKHTPETEYGIKAVPVGGYIRMIGMYPPEKGADPTMLRASSTGRFRTLIDDARQASLEEVTPADADRVFYKLPVRKRVVIMLGGPFMNLALAFVLFTIVISVIGTPQVTTTVGRVVPCVPTATSLKGATNSDGTCTPSTKTPAVLGGLLAGDTILSFDGTTVDTWEQAQDAIKSAQPGPVPVVVQRGEEQLTLTLPLQTVTIPVLDDAGKPTGETEKRNFVGVAPGSERQTQPVTAVPAYIWDTTVRSVTTLVKLPVLVWNLARQTFTDEPRDPNGILGPVGVGRITGEVVALENTPVADKVAGVLGLLAGLNLFLFLFNLIPLLPLDGGHVAGALWEAVKRAWAKVRRKPDPGPVDIAKALPVTYVVSLALLVMGAVTLLADLVKPITLGG